MDLQALKQDWITQFDKPLVIGGPCSAETEEQVSETAERINKDYVQVLRAGIWKPRTKPNSFEGVGAEGLRWLQKVKEQTGMPLAIEVASAEHVKLALAFDIDYLWLGARTSVNPFLVQEIAEALNGTDKVVLVKNPVNPDLALWIGAVQRLAQQDIKNLGLIHRGFSAYKATRYRNEPHWQIALEFKHQYPNIPMLCDPSHICGNRDMIADVSQKAFNFNYDGLMIETHRDPDKAWSDARQQITPERLYEILKGIELRKEDEQDSEYHAQLEALRTEIDDVDMHMMQLLSQRMDTAKSIGRLKKSHNVAIFQPERWKRTVEKAHKYGRILGLSPDFIDNLLKALHTESVNIQNDLMSKKEQAEANK